jgi:NADPH:quinone reductase
VAVLKMVERPAPVPERGQLRVRVAASALNRADLLQRRGLYPAPPGAPADVPGLEYAGEVESLGSGAHRWSVGDRVMGIVAGGGHAELVCVHEREAIRIPDRLSWDEAAAVPEAFLTAYDALVAQLSLRAGERILIHAAGSGVGTAAIQLARLRGAIVFGTSRTPEKLRKARPLGLLHPIDSSRADWADEVASLSEGKGIDAILDLVGGAMFGPNLRLLAERGRLLVAGLVGGARAEIDLGTLLRKRARIAGTVLRSRSLAEKITLAEEFSAAVLPLLEEGQLRPVIDSVFSFGRIAEAHTRLESNETFGKVVLRW